MAGNELSNAFASDLNTTDIDSDTNSDTDSERTSIFGSTYEHTILCTPRHS
jgi:hypothetical protein